MQERASEIIRILKLIKHREGGYFIETFRSEENIISNSGRYDEKRNLYSSIFYMLINDDFSVFHRLKSDEIWHHCEGTSFILHIIDKKGKLETRILGADIKNGENHQILVEKDQWFAAELCDKNSYGLAGCIVSPAFEYGDFELGSRNKLSEEYPDHKKIIKRLTRS